MSSRRCRARIGLAFDSVHFLELQAPPAIVPYVSTKKMETIASFEVGLEQLETIVKEMEDGKLPLEKLITHYETGSKLLAQCDAKLKEAEQKIEILRTKNADKPEFENFDPDQ